MIAAVWQLQVLKVDVDWAFEWWFKFARRLLHSGVIAITPVPRQIFLKAGVLLSPYRSLTIPVDVRHLSWSRDLRVTLKIAVEFSNADSADFLRVQWGEQVALTRLWTVVFFTESCWVVRVVAEAIAVLDSVLLLDERKWRCFELGKFIDFWSPVLLVMIRKRVLDSLFAKIWRPSVVLLLRITLLANLLLSEFTLKALLQLVFVGWGAVVNTRALTWIAPLLVLLYLVVEVHFRYKHVQLAW